MAKWIPSAELYNTIRDLLVRASGLPAAAGLSFAHGPQGRTIRRDRDQESEFPAKLTSGSGSAGYTFRRQIRKAGNTWGDLTAADEPLARAYEFNKATVPIGKVVLLRDVGIAGEYRFPFVRVGVAVQCPQGWYTLTVSGCGKPIPGQDVQLLKGGVVVGTFTTDSGGKAALVPTGPITDPYQWRITRARYFPVTSQQFTAFCNTNVSTTINPNSNIYICTPCDPFVPQKKTLFLTSALGSKTLTYSGVGWSSGSFNYTIPGSCDNGVGDTGQVTYSYRCLSPGVLTFVTLYTLCGNSNCRFGAQIPSALYGSISSTASRSFDVNQPINMTFSWPGDFAHTYPTGVTANPFGAGCVYPNFGTITTTE